MIGKLTGTVEHAQQNSVIIDVSGVGYKVTIPVKLLLNLPVNKVASLFIHTHVREDALDLYGFSSRDELYIFEKLLSVSGIGAKTALSVLSAGSVEQITASIINADVEFFNSISGIGKKSAQRIIVELKSTFGEKQELDLVEKHLPAFTETLDALKQFGFSAQEAREAIKSVKDAKGLSSEQLIKETLKLLGK